MGSLSNPENRPSIFLWKHHCDDTRIQLSRNELTKCLICNEEESSPSNLLRINKIIYPEQSINETKCDIVLSTSIPMVSIDTSRRLPMHIGVCDGRGRVLEFDKSGLLYDEQSRIGSTWNKCLSLGFIEHLELKECEGKLQVMTMWDELVAMIQDNFKPSPYDDCSNNCLDFILTFAKRLVTDIARRGDILPKQQVEELLEDTSDKVRFCQRFVVPKTKQLARYMVLDMQLEAGRNVIPSAIDRPSAACNVTS